MTNYHEITKILIKNPKSVLLTKLIKYLLYTNDYKKAEKVADHILWLFSETDKDVMKELYTREEENVQLRENTESEPGRDDLPF